MRAGFSLTEAIAATMILALISSSVFVIIDRSMEVATDSQFRMQALEVAREQIEKILCMGAVEETTDYGVSEKYPAIEWQTTIETFTEPYKSRPWLRAVCTASYYDTANEQQSVELASWLTDISDEQAQKAAEQKEKQKEQLSEEPNQPQKTPDDKSGTEKPVPTQPNINKLPPELQDAARKLLGTQ